MKIKLRAKYAYYMTMNLLLALVASVSSRIMFIAGMASNRYESKAYSTQVDILKPR